MLHKDQSKQDQTTIQFSSLFKNSFFNACIGAVITIASTLDIDIVTLRKAMDIFHGRYRSPNTASIQLQLREGWR